MPRTYVMLVALALSLLSVGALYGTFADRAAGQSASAEASALALDQPLPLGTRIPAEEVEFAVQPLSTSIGSTNCRKNAGNPHIAASYFPDAAKTVGGVIKCSTKKDYLHAQARLWKKEGKYYTLKDTGTGECNNCYRKVLPAFRKCWNRNSNKFWADAYVKVRNDGNVHKGVGQSQVVTLNCGGF